MARAEVSGEVFHAIPSEPREAGWKKFMEEVPLLMGSGLNTQETTLRLHELVTHGIQLQEIPASLMYVATMTTLIQGRTQDVINKVDRAHVNGMVDVTRAQLGEVLEDTRCHIDMPRIGKLRQAGVRSINNGPVHTVHMAHLTPMGKDSIYFGLTEGLDKVFGELCARVDEIEKQIEEGDMMSRIRLITYFQLWGAAIIHPFCDANGRAFMAKLVLDINKMGIPATKPLTLGELNPDLEDNALNLVSEAFHREFLKVNNIPLLTEFQAFTLIQNEQAYSMYMSMLKTAILQGVRDGINFRGEYEQYFTSAVQAITLALSKDKHFPRGYYERTLDSLRLRASAR